MRSSLYLDPLQAAEELRAYIVEDKVETSFLRGLSDRLDALLFSRRFFLLDEVAMIPETDDEPPRLDHTELRSLIAKRFPMLGLYWTALYSTMDSERPGEIAVGDAIDDLTDIAAEIENVRWYFEQHGREEALAALRWCYESHLWMHLMPLRCHLEELEIFG